MKKLSAYLFQCGPFEVAVYPESEEVAADAVPAYRIDVYHPGDDTLRPRFVCTGAEGSWLGLAASVAEDLISELEQAPGAYERWCRKHDLNPDFPQLKTRRTRPRRLRLVPPPHRGNR